MNNKVHVSIINMNRLGNKYMYFKIKMGLSGSVVPLDHSKLTHEYLHSILLLLRISALLQWMAFVDDWLNDPQIGCMVVPRFQMETLAPLSEPAGVY